MMLDRSDNSARFCGSYRPGDVEFLLKPIVVQAIRDLEQKERLIQSGARHYSEMLTPESLPSPRYMALFRDAFLANRAQMARDCLTLAALICARRDGPVTLVSLMRAGTPIGVILKHVVEKVFGRAVSHYSVSVIRDRGIDQVALRHILAQGHAAESLVFVDGWTGKGVISRELRHTINAFNQRHRLALDGGLYVLSDLAGSAACAASCHDYLIPSSILNATVSGLLSRSVLNEAIGPEDFHGCVVYPQFAAHDQSRQFADGLIADAIDLARQAGGGQVISARAEAIDGARAARISQQFIAATQDRYGISDVNLIKPGIGEATRVLLRRAPRLLILRDPGCPDVAHLKVLAAEKAVPVKHEADLPYQAVSLIRSAIDA